MNCRPLNRGLGLLSFRGRCIFSAGNRMIPGLWFVCWIPSMGLVYFLADLPYFTLKKQPFHSCRWIYHTWMIGCGYGWKTPGFNGMDIFTQKSARNYRKIVFQPSISGGYVSFREGNYVFHVLGIQCYSCSCLLDPRSDKVQRDTCGYCILYLLKIKNRGWKRVWISTNIYINGIYSNRCKRCNSYTIVKGSMANHSRKVAIS